MEYLKTEVLEIQIPGEEILKLVTEALRPVLDQHPGFSLGTLFTPTGDLSGPLILKCWKREDEPDPFTGEAK